MSIRTPLEGPQADLADTDLHALEILPGVDLDADAAAGRERGVANVHHLLAVEGDGEVVTGCAVRGRAELRKRPG